MINFNINLKNNKIFNGICIYKFSINEIHNKKN